MTLVFLIAVAFLAGGDPLQHIEIVPAGLCQEIGQDIMNKTPTEIMMADDKGEMHTFVVLDKQFQCVEFTQKDNA